MKMRKLGAGVMSLLCLLITLLTPAASAAEFDQKAMDGVVYLVTDLVYSVSDGFDTYEIPAEYNSRGSGFFIGEKGKDPQYLITNYHMVQEILEEREKGNFIIEGDDGAELICNADPSHFYIYYDQNDREEVFVVDYDRERDLALLRLGQPTDKRVPLTIALPDSDIVGAKVFALGYPALADDTISATSSFSLGDLTVTSGVVSRLLTEQGTGTRQIQIDAVISGGNSGGPLIDQKGRAVGVNTSGSTQLEAMNYAVSMEDLIPLLNKNSIAYDLDDGKGGMMWIIIGGAALIAVVVVLMVVLKGKKKTAPVAEPDPVPAPAPAPAPAQPRLRPILRSMCPQHHGMPVYVDVQPVTIGRDKSCCQLVFEEPAPGVSSRHCSVSWSGESGEFLLTDTGSTYGTFLADGRKLNNGVVYRLRPGTTFYLGDRSNVIRVELG